MPEYDYIQDVLQHKRLVTEYMQMIASELFQRAAVHDNSKFLPEEAEIYGRVVPKLKTLEYGSEEYKETVKELGPALQHHYEHNAHHPEHFEAGIDGMNLVDVIEMVCDWVAATRRSMSANVYQSLEVNRKRFDISPQMIRVISETILLLEKE
jgi:hypothetical protein